MPTNIPDSTQPEDREFAALTFSFLILVTPALFVGISYLLAIAVFTYLGGQ
jgi:hypothetical protein